MGSSSSWSCSSSMSSRSSLSIGLCLLLAASLSSPLLPSPMSVSSSPPPALASFSRFCSVSQSTRHSSTSSSSLGLYLAWSTLTMRPFMVAPPRLSTARSVLRWSSYLSQPKPRDLPVSLSRASLRKVGSPYCEKMVMTSPSLSSYGSPPK